jgi:hypothetical protein
MSTISASTTSTTAYQVTADTTGALVLQTGSTPTTAVTISSSQVATFANDPIMGVSALTGNIAAARITSALNASGSAPIYAARAWVNFNGTGTVAIRASGNVTSITDNGTGNYTVNFTTAMPSADYSVAGNPSNTAQAYLYGLDVFAVNTGSVQVRTHDYNSLQDTAVTSVTVFR